jgi:hypothetical protein
MDNCGYCEKAKKELKTYIDSRFIVLEHSDNAPSDITSFPHFVSPKTKSSCSGFRNKKTLFEKLGYIISK